MKTDIAPTTIFRDERLMEPHYQSGREGAMPLWSDIVLFERSTRSLLKRCTGWHEWKVKALEGSSPHGRQGPLPPWKREWGMPFGFWAFLRLTLWHAGSQLMEDADSLLWLLVSVNGYLSGPCVSSGKFVILVGFVIVLSEWCTLCKYFLCKKYLMWSVIRISSCTLPASIVPHGLALLIPVFPFVLSHFDPRQLPWT